MTTEQIHDLCAGLGRDAGLTTKQSVAFEPVIKMLIEALIASAIPLEALRMQPNLDYLSAEVRQAITEATDKIRATLDSLGKDAK